MKTEGKRLYGFGKAAVQKFKRKIIKIPGYRIFFFQYPLNIIKDLLIV